VNNSPGTDCLPEEERIKMHRYILTLDQGTTSSRSLVFDEKARVVSEDRRPIRQIYPKPGWVEHDPYNILETQLETAKNAVAGVGSDSIGAIGITNQRETTILWEKDTGKPVGNAVVWQCRRSSSICNELKREGLSQVVHRKTGLIIDAYFSASKIMWMFRKYPGLLEKAKNGELLFGTVDTWLLYNLTGRHVTDYTNASRTMLFNIETLTWDEELLALLKIPRSILPDVQESGSFFGETRSDIFGRPIPVMAVAGDQQAALFGQGCWGKGMVKGTYGTGCFILMHTGKKPSYSANGLITTCGCETGRSRAYALEGSVFICGAVVQWLRDRLGIIADAAETERIARSVPDSGGVYFVPAFVGLGAPFWNMESRGTVTGLTGGTSREHLVRAGLEAIAYQCYSVVRCMEEDSGVRLRQLRADGGASGNDFLMQFQADILGAVIQRPSNVESTAGGVFLLAGLVMGLFSGKDEAKRLIMVEREFHPEMDTVQREKLIKGWETAVQRTLL
jgi:glycerol kinase